MSEEVATAIIHHLLEQKIITLNEARIMRAAIAQSALTLPVSAKDTLRAGVMRGMLVQAFRNAEGGDRQHDV